MAHSTGLSDRVDIYDLSNGNWTTSTLPSGKRVLSGGVASQDKVLFCGGITSWEEIWGTAPIQPSPYIDIFNINTGTWSIDSMEVKKSGFSTVNVNGTIFFAGGILDNATTFHVEKLHMATMNNTHSCLDQPKQLKNAVVKNENILFFTYNPFMGIDNRRFDIYNTQTDQWSVGVITDNNFL